MGRADVDSKGKARYPTRINVPVICITNSWGPDPTYHRIHRVHQSQYLPCHHLFISAAKHQIPSPTDKCFRYIPNPQVLTS
ncbi:hypothetical protein HBH56_221170 [Parastagonospora nodorum]|uniref:Uncharacterized protein n=1 Tax=Phaeosphaeria nodorum (strain SN15 / ATCC MYA-4574 / FGSC 10173) TaxID=321614 RepID=A0A7U2F2G1_PHANO|nr:hypothetical protein HBH56_221170 [Parastagonospora nodorum]QRC97147.1 hypothetical protein JI435_410190 [Parastagonospora nodorum SN15]KAH3924112.1 hypothetical protein HBH54_200580 [Parastagonospora nodorum]KAH3944623.1 hypothetical protein HBH53_156950 [Parastagonospora nodorum]KAH3963320.1 hypothetical protein HBH51_167750 [Parastagonospora nodorum]